MESKNRFVLGTMIVPFALVGIGVVYASSVVTPNTFVAGTPAVAAEVNVNFAAHAAAINDNDARIDNASRIEVTTPSTHVSVANGDTSLHELTSVLVNAPSAGKVIVTMTGYTVFFGDGKTLDVAVSDDNTAMPSSGIIGHGRLDGAGGNRFTIPFCAKNVFPVVAGNHTFYGLTQGNNVFSSGSANVVPRSIVAQFVATP